MLTTLPGEPRLPDVGQDPSFLAVPVNGAPGSAGKRRLWQQLGVRDRALLGTDGTFTALLQHLTGEPIAVSALSQSVETLERADPRLRIERGCSRLERAVLLCARSSGRAMAYAESLIAVDRLAEPMRHALEAGNQPIGLLLRRAEVETFRELLDWGLCQHDHPAREYFPPSALLFRTYRIVVHAQPIMVITECFPIASDQNAQQFRAPLQTSASTTGS